MSLKIMPEVISPCFFSNSVFTMMWSIRVALWSVTLVGSVIMNEFHFLDFYWGPLGLAATVILWLVNIIFLQMRSLKLSAEIFMFNSSCSTLGSNVVWYGDFDARIRHLISDYIPHNFVGCNYLSMHKSTHMICYFFAGSISMPHIGYITDILHVSILCIWCICHTFHWYFSSGKTQPSIYFAPKDGGPTFAILHYAGKVTYDLNGVLDKVRDTLPVSILFTMKSKQISVG